MAEKLTEEQERFLEECSREFANRYTDAEEEFKLVCEKDLKPPPIVEPWYNKPRRNFNWSRQRDRGDHGGGHRDGSGSGGGHRDHGGSGSSGGGGGHYRRQNSRYQRNYQPYRNRDNHYQNHK